MSGFPHESTLCHLNFMCHVQHCHQQSRRKPPNARVVARGLKILNEQAAFPQELKIQKKTRSNTTSPLRLHDYILSRTSHKDVTEIKAFNMFGNWKYSAVLLLVESQELVVITTFISLVVTVSRPQREIVAKQLHDQRAVLVRVFV